MLNNLFLFFFFFKYQRRTFLKLELYITSGFAGIENA